MSPTVGFRPGLTGSGGGPCKTHCDVPVNLNATKVSEREEYVDREIEKKETGTK
jgi:hypothetical protein